MKTQKTIIGILITTLSLLSCGGKDRSDITAEDSNGSKNSKELLSEVHSDGKLLMKYQYDDDNRLIKTETFDDEKPLQNIIYRYNANGKLEEMEVGDAYNLSYQYDSQNNLTGIKEYIDDEYMKTYTVERTTQKTVLKGTDQEGNVTEMSAQFDAKGNVVKQSFHLSGNAAYSWVSEWGSYDNKKSFPGEADGLFSQIAPFINNPGTLKLTNTMEPGKITEEKYEYTYTDAGYPAIKKVLSKSGQLKETWTFKYIKAN